MLLPVLLLAPCLRGTSPFICVVPSATQRRLKFAAILPQFVDSSCPYLVNLPNYLLHLSSPLAIHSAAMNRSSHAAIPATTLSPTLLTTTHLRPRSSSTTTQIERR
jgi:hypothetical protein